MAQINQLSVTSGSVSLPNSGSVAIFSNIEDSGNLYIKTSAGTVTPVGNTSGGGGSGSSGTSGTSGAGSSGTGGTSGTSGAGSSGTGGTSGTSGDGTGGTSGTSGTQGATGTNGTSGTQGATGTNGTSGTQGATGSSGTSGTQGAPGATGSSGTSGTGGGGASLTLTDGSNTVANVAQITVTGGTVGGTSPNATLTISGGGGGTATIYNTVSRYQAFLSGDIEVFLVSSATVNTGLTWSRSGTTLTITDTSHGRSNGDMVIVRNANADNFNGTITVVDVNTFTLTTTNTGGTSGTEAAYSLGFTVGTPTAAALTIAAPSGGDVQLLSVLFATGARSGTTLAITVPQSATNGAGANTTGQNSFFPVIRVQTISTGAVQLAAMTLNTSSNFNVFNLTSMNATNSNLVRLDF